VRGVRQGLALAAALAVVLLSAPASFAASEGGAVTQTCRGVNEGLRGPCRGAEQVSSSAVAECRNAGGPDAACPRPDIEAYERSWVHRALGLQYDLAGDVPMRNAPWVGTHNSFNSHAEMGPTLSDTDSNQQVSLVDQLRMDVRSLELDVHTFRSAPVVCHARGEDQAHAGCSIEKTLDVVLAEIADWLKRNPDQILMLYVEDHTEGTAGHGDAARVIDETVGPLLYRPQGSGCVKLPLEVTRDQILAAGKQVLIVSGCGTGAAWQQAVFDWSSHGEERPVGYTDFPQCGKDFPRAFYDSQVVRYYEDSTALTAGASAVGAATVDDGITPETAGRLARCGVDLTGFDQLLPDDGRLGAMVWSWAPSQPGPDDCAIQRVDGRWESRSCDERHAVACRQANGSWTVVVPAVPAAAAPGRCSSAGAEHAVPRTGYENQLLRAAGDGEAWLGIRRAGGRWTPSD
jgi:hypothetical protein